MYYLESERSNMEYVPTKLNESVMEKMSKLEDQEESLLVHSAAIRNSYNLKSKNSKKMTKIGSKREGKKDDNTGINLIEKKREIHEAYQIVLNEYHRRLSLRRKSLEQTVSFRRRSIQIGDIEPHFNSSTKVSEGKNIFIRINWLIRFNDY